jgi:hypothetical protein
MAHANTGSIQGRLTGDAGSACLVKLLDGDGLAPIRFHVIDSSSFTFAFDDLKPGRYRVQIDLLRGLQDGAAAGFAETSFCDDAVLEVRSGQQSQVECRATATEGSFRGEVR